MEKRETAKQTADAGLPRPIVLRPEELTEVAAAGSTVPAVATRPIIFGGIRVPNT